MGGVVARQAGVIRAGGGGDEAARREEDGEVDGAEERG